LDTLGRRVADFGLTIENLHRMPYGEKLQIENIDTLGCIPYDKAVFDSSIQGRTIFDLAEDNPAILSIRKILEAKLKMEVSNASS
jgi:CO dehydrogenase nickel-insertion accessory protein CooC1